MSQKSPKNLERRIRYGFARKRAEGLVTAFGFHRPPIDVKEIAKKLGLAVVLEDLDEEIAGLLTTAEKERTICVNKKHSRNRQRFSIAHEIGHIKNLDVRFMTIAAVMVGSITIIADMFLRSLWFGAGRRRSAKIDARAQLIILAVAIVAAILAPICARLLYMACSRRREYLADASAARFTRYPEGLASALEKIALHVKSTKKVNRALAPLYIVNPLQARAAAGMLSTHPPTEQRIKILRAMAGGAGYVDYENAFRKVRGGDEACIGKQTLGSEGSVPARQASAEGAI